MTPKEHLEVLKKIDIIIDGCAWNYKDTDYKESFENIEQALTELDRLQKKEIPMKVDIGTYGILSDTHRCPSCNKRIIDGTYCRYCGQKLDWSDEK